MSDTQPTPGPLPGITDAEADAYMAALEDPDASAARLAEVEAERDEAVRILDALPALLRADGPAGDAIRERLGIRWVTYASPGGFTWRRLADDWEQTS